MQVGHDVLMEQDWERLGEAIRQRRQAIGMSQIELAEAAGLGRSAVQGVERGRSYARPQLSHRSIAQALGWTAESIVAVLAGEEPTLSEAGAAPTPAPAAEGANQGSPEVDTLLDDLSEHVKLALLGGQVVAGDVIDLAPDDPDSVAVLILKRGKQPNASPEQMRARLRKWAQLQRAARDIFSDED
jgi:transcriptional regulator with XRE-family HTH domain